MIQKSNLIFNSSINLTQARQIEALERMIHHLGFDEGKIVDLRHGTLCGRKVTYKKHYSLNEVKDNHDVLKMVVEAALVGALAFYAKDSKGKQVLHMAKAGQQLIAKKHGNDVDMGEVQLINEEVYKMALKSLTEPDTGKLENDQRELVVQEALITSTRIKETNSKRAPSKRKEDFAKRSEELKQVRKAQEKGHDEIAKKERRRNELLLKEKDEKKERLRQIEQRNDLNS